MKNNTNDISSNGAEATAGLAGCGCVGCAIVAFEMIVSGLSFFFWIFLLGALLRGCI